MQLHCGERQLDWLRQRWDGCFCFSVTVVIDAATAGISSGGSGERHGWLGEETVSLLWSCGLRLDAAHMTDRALAESHAVGLEVGLL